MSVLAEIHEQPDSLRRVLARNRSVAAAATRVLDGASYVMIAARGTSDNAARYAQYVWGACNRLPVALAAPSLFGPYRKPPRLDGAVVVGISQSGQSPDILAVLHEANQQQRPTIAITNDIASPLAAAAGLVLPLHAGPERSVAATKTYTAELLVVAMLAGTGAGDGTLDAALEAVPDGVAAMLATEPAIATAAERYADMDRAAVLGRGYNLATAHEWALKLTEMAYVAAQPWSTADFQHGPVALVEPGFPILATVADGPLAADAAAFLRTLASERRARVLAISDRPDVLAVGDGIPLPEGTPEWLSPITAAVAAQLFCAHVAAARNVDPDTPRNLSKITKTT